jgi:putative oligomerization/nucleic acid binding protein
MGVGALAMPKRLKCNGCGTNLKRGGVQYAPGAQAHPNVGSTESHAPERASVGGGAATNPTSEIEQLAALHARGALTDEEFQAAKARLLGL